MNGVSMRAAIAGAIASLGAAGMASRTDTDPGRTQGGDDTGSLVAPQPGKLLTEEQFKLAAQLGTLRELEMQAPQLSLSASAKQVVSLASRRAVEANALGGWLLRQLDIGRMLSEIPAMESFETSCTELDRTLRQLARSGLVTEEQRLILEAFVEGQDAVKWPSKTDPRVNLSGFIPRLRDLAVNGVSGAKQYEELTFGVYVLMHEVALLPTLPRESSSRVAKTLEHLKGAKLEGQIAEASKDALMYLLAAQNFDQTQDRLLVRQALGILTEAGSRSALAEQVVERLNKAGIPGMGRQQLLLSKLAEIRD